MAAPKSITTQQLADELPDREFCALTAGKIEAHLLNGHWELAAMAFRAAHAEWQQELKERREILTRTPEQWLERPICELAISFRNANRLDEVGAHTIRLAIELVNSGDVIPNFGPESRNQFWQAIEERKIAKRPPCVPGGKPPREVTMRDRKWNWGRDALDPDAKGT